MNFDFSPEQKQLQDQVARLLARTCPPGEVRRVLDGHAPFARAAWRALGDMDALGAAIPEAHGGAGLGALELCLVAEEAGRALAPLPLSSSIYLAAGLVLRAGDAGQRERLLPGLAAGTLVGTLARAEGRAAAGREPACRVEGGRLWGVKLPVTDGMAADFALVTAREAAGVSLFLVPLGDPAVERTAVPVVDPTRPAARLAFHGAPAERLGPPGGAAALLGQALDRAAVLLAFEQVGGAAEALRRAVAYACGRIAFGRPVGSFQAVKHKLADVHVRLRVARAHACYGAWALATDAPDLPLAAAAARVAATGAFRLAAEEMLQVHGGIGFTWEADCHLFLRRAQHTGLCLDGDGAWRARLFAGLLDRTPADTGLLGGRDGL